MRITPRAFAQEVGMVVKARISGLLRCDSRTFWLISPALSISFCLISDGERFDPPLWTTHTLNNKKKISAQPETPGADGVSSPVWGKVSYLRRLTLSVLPCCCGKTAGRGCGADGSRMGRVRTGCRCWSRGTRCCRAGGERGSRSGDSAAGSVRRPSTGSSAVSVTAAQTP